MNAPALDPWVPRPYRVIAVTRELGDTVTLELRAQGEAIGPFEAGQFNMLYAFGVGEIAVSSSGDPALADRVVHTVRAVGAVSAAIAALDGGATLGVRGPFGHGWPVASAEQRDVLVVAGGLGLAPLRPAIYQLLRQRERYRRVMILIGMRNPSEILYRHELEQWRSRLDVELEVTVDRAEGGWRGHVGVVPALIPRLGLDAGRTVAMVCGPEIMMRFAANALHDIGVPDEQIYLSMERNMKCAIGLCGRCQFGPVFICKDGPVMPLGRIAPLWVRREI